MSLRHRLGYIYYAAVLTVSLTLNVALGVAARDQAGMRKGAALFFQAGDTFPSLVTQGADGLPEAVNATSGTIFYLFSPQCEWCFRDRGNLEAIASGSRGKRKVVGLTATDVGLADYLRLSGFPGDVAVVTVDTLASSIRDRFRTTPQTLVVEGGVVVQAWPGALMGGRLTNAQTFFGFSLPGPTEATRAQF